MLHCSRNILEFCPSYANLREISYLYVGVKGRLEILQPVMATCHHVLVLIF